MANIKKPCIYLAGLTIDKQDAEDKVRAGLLNKVTIEDENGKLVNQAIFYIDSFRETQDLISSSAYKYHYLSSIQDFFHIIMGAYKLYPTPQLNFLNYSDDPNFEELNETAIVMGVKQEDGFSNKIFIRVWDGDSPTDILKLHCLWWSFDIIKSFLTSKNDIDFDEYKIPYSSFKYADPLGYNKAKINNLRSQLSKAASIQPNKVAYLILNPMEYYKSNVGIESIIRNYIRNASKINNVNDFIRHLKTIYTLLSTEPTYLQIKNAKERLAIISEYVIQNSLTLDLAIQRESMELNGAYKAFKFIHYSKTENVVLLSRVSGPIRFNPHEWIKSTDRSIINDDRNARFHNILPESKSYEINKNRVSKISSSSSLVGNYSVSEVSLSRIAKTFDHSAIKINESEQNLINLAPAISFHQTEILDFILYKGYFEGIPSFDKQFSSKLISLMENEFAAKLSGIQFKLPLLLTNKNGQNELKRQTGNLPFTHIAKFPMPTYEDITLSEWLALKIIERSFVIDTAQTTLVAFDHDCGPENMGKMMNEPNGIEKEKHHELDEFFKSEVFNRFSIEKQDPPFLLSTRFDIPKDGENKVIKAFDFAELLLRGPEEKYEADFEEIGQWIQNRVHDETDRNIALLAVYKQLICSYLLHNNDLHLKNITLLEITNKDTNTKKMMISPCYDVIITPLVYFDSDSDACYQSALRVNGTNHPTVNDLVICGTNGFGFQNDEASKIFEECFNDIKRAISVMKIDLPYEIDSRPRWKDVIVKGLNIVMRNIRCIERNNHCYNNTYDKTQSNQVSFNLNS